MTLPHSSTDMLFGKSSQVVLSDIAQSSDDNNIVKLIESSRRMMGAGDLVGSMEVLLNAVQLHPNNLECNALLGGVLLGLRKYEEAEKFLYVATHLSNWTDAGAISNLAVSLASSNTDFAVAIQVLQRGLDVNNDNQLAVDALSRTMGDVYFSSGNFATAADWYLSVALSLQTDVDLWILASTVRFPASGRDYAFAKNVLLKAIELNRLSSALYLHLGLAVHQGGEGDAQSAVALYRQSLACDPANNEAVSALATALHETGRLFDALDIYTQAEALAPRNPVLLANYARLLAALSRPEKGLTLAARAVEIEKDNIIAIDALKLFS